MVEQHPEAGTTLVELLVVVTILAIMGTLTTVGIVQGFDAQRAAADVGETLDGTRIATQRVRDFARGADEVCASSDGTALTLWTDDDGNGVVSNPELDIFELVPDASGNDVFQRRVPGTGEVQLIRDDIINAALFTYDIDPADQPASLVCKDGVAVTGGPSLIRRVQVTFTVDNPEPGAPDLTTETVIQVRNAGLQEDPRDPPTADFVESCPTTLCSFDASSSTDTDGLVVQWLWDFGDGTTGTGESEAHAYPAADTDYDVTLTVVDNDGVSDTIVRTVRSGVPAGANATPVAAFTYSCSGRICTFDGSTSTDDGGVATWRWDFGDGTVVTETDPSTTHTFPANNTYVVTLRVTDGAAAPLSDETSESVTASSTAVRVEQIKGVGSVVAATSGTWKATYTVRLSFTTAGAPGAGLTISGKVKTTGFQDVSCSTDGTGACSFEVPGIKAAKDAEFTLSSVVDPSGTYTYDSGQNKATVLTVSKNSTASAP